MNFHGEISEKDSLDLARSALSAEAHAITQAADRLDANFHRAVQLLLKQNSKVIITGIGKSGHIAQKIVSTFCSTGTPAVFLHATEAVHGDLGIYTPGDPTILISKSGTTAELVRLIPILREFKSPLIGILGNINSPLARAVDIVLDASVQREADPLNLAPTSSSTVALAMGDALVAAIIWARGFDLMDFARLHPSGQLGRDLWLKVEDVMHKKDQVACATEDTPLQQIVIAMSKAPLGAACILDGSGQLVGIITDGDMRRILQTNEDTRTLKAKDVMTPNPITISDKATLKEAVDCMENRRSQISVLPVLDHDGGFVGLVRIHDIYQSDLKT